jgi:hypothetical protein
MIDKTSEAHRAESHAQVSRVWRRSLVLIGLGQLIAAVATLWLLCRLNSANGLMEEPVSNWTPLVNSALLGFLGSLFYFGRKVYVYLITDKFGRIKESQGGSAGATEEAVDRLRGALVGYCIYLSTRPLAGLAIGPLLLMAVLAGLMTFSPSPSGSRVAVSVAGTCLIYFISFVGGYSSSDLFDYLSGLGAKLARRIQVR